MFSSRNQSIGCAVAWVIIARDSESEYPFYLVGQFCGIWAGHLFSPFLKVGRLCDNCFLNISTVFTNGCEWTNVGHPVCLLKNILIDSNPPVTCWHLWSLIVVLTAPKTSNFDLIWFGSGGETGLDAKRGDVGTRTGDEAKGDLKGRGLAFRQHLWAGVIFLQIQLTRRAWKGCESW